MFGPIQTVIFDLDGTLVNSMGSVIRGLGEAIYFATGTRIPKEELILSFGPAPRGILTKWLPEEKVDSALNWWLEFEKSLSPEDFDVFPGVEAMLDGLKNHGIQLLVFTGRDRAGSLRIINSHGWIGKYFDEEKMSCGDDGIRPKPSGDGIVRLQKKLNLDLSKTLMVGDHAHDMAAGKEAGCKTAAVLWDVPPGKGTQRSRFREGWERWDKVECDLRLDNPQSLLNWFIASSKT